MFGPDGKEACRYAKVHSTFGNIEARFYRHGESFPVFNVDGAGVGIMICYDRQLPETARLLRLNGAGVILNPAATGNFSRGWNTRLLQTRAYENGCFVVSVNHAFPRLNGRSLACDPGGKVIARCPPWECEKVVSLDIEQVHEKASILHTRRQSVYGGLLDPVTREKEERKD